MSGKKRSTKTLQTLQWGGGLSVSRGNKRVGLLYLQLDLFFRNENSAQRGSFGPDIPADIPPKTSVRPSKSWKKQAFRNGHPTRTSIKKLRSAKLRADSSFPIFYLRKLSFVAYGKLVWSFFAQNLVCLAYGGSRFALFCYLRFPPVRTISQKNPRAHKNKIGTPPPKKKNQNTPPPKTRSFMDMGFFLQKERIFPGVHKIDAPISGPRIADKNFTDTRIFLKCLFFCLCFPHRKLKKTNSEQRDLNFEYPRYPSLRKRYININKIFR